jgi:hypothetical protein
MEDKECIKNFSREIFRMNPIKLCVEYHIIELNTSLVTQCFFDLYVVTQVLKAIALFLSYAFIHM